MTVRDCGGKYGIVLASQAKSGRDCSDSSDSSDEE